MPEDSGTPSTFQNNAGKTAEFVKLREHPYLKGKGLPTCPECRRQGLTGNTQLKDEESQLCPMHKLARELEKQKEDSRRVQKELLSVLRSKTVSFPDFNGRTAKFVRNSVTENLRYGELYSLKKEILENIDDYLNAEYEYTFRENVKPDEKFNVRGYHIIMVAYKGSLSVGQGSRIELQFEEDNNGIRFHLIKKVK